MIRLVKPRPRQLRRAGRLSVAVPAVALAPCSSSGSSGSTSGTSASGTCSSIPSGPIKMANIVPLSGPTATSGQLIQDEASVEQAYFNAHDSICGHQVQITNYNDKGDPATSLSIARQLTQQGETI